MAVKAECFVERVGAEYQPHGLRQSRHRDARSEAVQRSELMVVCWDAAGSGAHALLPEPCEALRDVPAALGGAARRRRRRGRQDSGARRHRSTRVVGANNTRNCGIVIRAAAHLLVGSPLGPKRA